MDQLEAEFDFDSTTMEPSHYLAYVESEKEVFAKISDGKIEGFDVVRDYEIEDEKVQAGIMQDILNHLHSEYGYDYSGSDGTYTIENTDTTGVVMNVSGSANSGEYEYGVYINVMKK
ncbi:hypothetical protein [Salibacterium sp. K-3]